MPYVKDPRVDAYIDRLPAWQGEICRRVRDLVHAADRGWRKLKGGGSHPSTTATRGSGR